MNLNNQTCHRNTTYVLEQQRRLQQEENERHRREVEEQQAMLQRRRREEENNNRRSNTPSSVYGQYDCGCIDIYGNSVQKFKTYVDVSPVSSEEEKREIEEMLNDWTEKRRG